MHAVTRPYHAAGDAAVELEDIAAGDGYLFARNGVGVAGRGVAARWCGDVDELAERWRGIPHEDHVGGVHPVAFVSLPFEPDAPGELIVPEITVVRRGDASAWITTTTVDGGTPAAPPIAAARPAPAAGGYAVRPLTPVDRYLAAVRTARDAVRAASIEKAVIAREVEVTSDAPIDVHAVLLRLKASFGSSYRYSIDGFIGASPELLVAVDASTVRSHPLAGTAPRTGDPEADAAIAAALLASTKNQIEHRVVIEAIYDTLLPWCSYLDWEPEPSIMAVANVQHLATAMEGLLSEPRPSALTLARQLSPTPALGGFPRDEALALIREAEGFARGRYGGAVGWVDTAGNGTFAVAIRCAELSDDRRSARLVAGGGIVADSDPSAELAETQAKLQAMLAAIIRP
ncbi:MAG: isochorismate synthase [Ilumatobacteraceae bacterium]|nr:isochorismate synthase [Ilumatobacteraceae bacterium]